MVKYLWVKYLKWWRTTELVYFDEEFCQFFANPMHKDFPDILVFPDGTKYYKVRKEKPFFGQSNPTMLYRNGRDYAKAVYFNDRLLVIT